MTTDSDLRESVLEAIQADNRITYKTVTVEVHKGYVTLAGVVGSPEDRYATENAAAAVAGVRGVNCELNIGMTDVDVITPN